MLAVTFVGPLLAEVTRNFLQLNSLDNVYV